MAGPNEDVYSRVDYRRLIAWKRRIEREGPFLRRQLERAPDASVLDVGCGTGEHVAFFAEAGARAVGLDPSESMIEAARTHEAEGRGRFVLGAAADARRLLGDEPPFGLALCVGNVLPHVQDEMALAAFLEAVRDVLLPRGRLVVQLLNYERILSTGVRHLPLDVRAGDGAEEIVFLRLMKPLVGGRMLFFPTTLVLDPEAEEPVRVKGAKRVELRAWTRPELETAFFGAGFDVAWYGDVEEGPYDPAASQDLVAVAVRRPSGAEGG